MTVVYTIGHSRHAVDRFVALLREHEIVRVIDVRSQPLSKWSPHFDKADLARHLGDHGLQYLFLGQQLGGRPAGHAFYRADGTVDYDRRAQDPDFRDGIESLLALARDRRTVAMCTEEDPSRCHRRLLLAPVLARSGAAVVHVRGDGRLEPERGHAPPSAQLDLFGGGR